MAKPTKPIPVLSEKYKKRFFSRISTIPTDQGCLEWMAGKFPGGYGSFCIVGKDFSAHRIAYFMANSEDPGNLLIRHSCHNPSCCNPVHLSIGTYQDNTDDMVRAGRANPPKGDSHWSRNKPELVSRGEYHNMSKLTELQVISIRADTRLHREIAIDYGVRQPLISKIKSRKRWAHIP